MIVGVTHDKDGRSLVRRSVMTKVAIGRGPTAQNNYPSKLDHFIFLKKEAGEKAVEWTDDQEKIEHYTKLAGGEDPTEIVIILMDDDIDQIFRTEYAWWASTGKKCYGNGEQATRDGKPWTPCANSGECPQNANGDCKPSADLYFMLADFPSLGTVCRLHTSSYQSIREIYSALVDLRNMMGGRLQGLPVKLFVRPEKNVYEGPNGQKKTGTKYILGLELRARSLPGMLDSVTESAKVFADLRKVMGGQRLEIVEDDQERAPEIAGEFHTIDPAGPPRAELPPAVAVNPDLERFHAAAEAQGLNRAARHMLLGKHDGNLAEALKELKALAGSTASAPRDMPAPAGTPAKKAKGSRQATTAPAPLPEPAPAAPAAEASKNWTW